MQDIETTTIGCRNNRTKLGLVDFRGFTFCMVLLFFYCWLILKSKKSVTVVTWVDRTQNFDSASRTEPGSDAFGWKLILSRGTERCKPPKKVDTD